jgi:phospholipid/cholesterol/gamma-HCH transport system ATP-binding protein
VARFVAPSCKRGKKPESGSVVFDGVELTSLEERALFPLRRRIAMLFQSGALFDSMNVFDNIAFPLREHTELSPDEIAATVSEKLGMVRLKDVESKMPSDLSGGMRKRVALARSLALKPEVVLFDEPTTGLDPVIKAVIDDLILELQRRLDPTTITITHDLTSAFKIADRIALLFRGKIVACAPPAEFRELPDERVQQFIRGLPTGPLTE